MVFRRFSIYKVENYARKMDNAINNATLSSILDELKFLNNNLSNGNLLGGDNRMFTPNGNSLKDLIESRKSLKRVEYMFVISAIKYELKHLRILNKKDFYDLIFLKNE